ncbi:unnamed protein product [Toxocara canis]|uniref:Uncharacterized protein n=1 Tax=Toxocara canis TaxID=6265 RepID=A0A183U9D4_TOXCA|nr:unnamed protein product [Toxocara canis]
MATQSPPSTASKADLDSATPPDNVILIFFP